ncbi:MULTISPECIES: dTDP-4-amino-4,6-dideoxygalactose transaminase [unclassified Agarivorans]|uniref:dTDP-4-amino-4,6-dideoxygalactose transaminase n=1 Tax=unclassified Agarivorans TaxID=2636026 RepID=UPI0026E230C8|nr:MULTISPECIES: dTDP-4-amino-4,6-dideoxygalactose transaminase [unclassified Agarivorans]MDO6684712.1 dTDP-4-amino-4,6-dideoxygalactose transaminase [Agarivorans sp. 3_MG-2023]MDO6715127.1 dTDP-4-amino-4,6-dideoxygalactose transaminase [Agarivorans sp. 2_MG-2023]
MVQFNRPTVIGNEIDYISRSIGSSKISGDGVFGKKCHAWFEKKLGCQKVLLTPSCTQALEMAAILINIQPGDEVIMPSYTFVSTANAFVLRGAVIVFIDIRKDTMNINELLIEEAITDKTKAIVVVHYAGISCEMDSIMNIADRHKLYVVEDAAQCLMSRYKDRPLGTIGHFGAYSFHETKNYTSGGEGGLLLINDCRFNERAEIIREKGTNRNQFIRQVVDKYTWVDIGSSYLLSDLQAAYLFAQLESADIINAKRKYVWDSYLSAFKSLEENGSIDLPFVPDRCEHNGHIFYIKVKNEKVRDEMLNYLKEMDVNSVFHYVPLHSSNAGFQFGRFNGEDRNTSSESSRLIRLPLFFNITDAEITLVISSVKKFFIR